MRAYAGGKEIVTNIIPEKVEDSGPGAPGPKKHDIRVAGINIEWNTEDGTCSFEGLPVAMMWVDTTLMGLMSGVQAMVGTERFGLAQQSEGRRSVEADWTVISRFPDFRDGFAAIATVAAVAGWGVWELVGMDAEDKRCRFRVWNSWEGRYQKTMGVCWGSGMLAGKLAGYCSRLFGTNCWATQTSYIARGDEFDEFEVAPSGRTVENELQNLLAADHATRADMAVALEKLRGEVAERERAQDALRRSEERFRAVVEDQTELIYRSLPDGTITFVNEAYCRYFGKSREELIGTRFVLNIPEADRAKIKREMDSLTPARSVWTHEGQILIANGNVRWHHWTNRAIFNEKNEIVEFQGVGHDITERKLAEQERALLEEQLRQSQKMEAIGRLAGGVAHDFNNILTGIRGCSEIILAELDPTDPLHADIEEIRSASERAAALTGQLLAFSRKQLIAPTVINPNDILENSKKLLGRIIGEDIELVFLAGNRLWNVKADPVQIDQILVNLAVNARDAMPTGGKLTIETAGFTADEEFCSSHPGMILGDYVMISVSDTGAGMDDEVIDHVFEPFFSTKEKGDGTGLGLATVYGIVKQNRGFIFVDSERGVGTSFKIYLPGVGEKAEVLRVPDVPLSVMGYETVLLVEDEDMVRNVAQRTLVKHGYTVLDAAGGEQALKVAGEHDGDIDLLFVDVIMPKMNGKDLYDKLRETCPKLKVLYMSGYTDHVIAHHGVLEKETPFIQKPFSIETLVGKVREVLDGKVNEPDARDLSFTRPLKPS